MLSFNRYILFIVSIFCLFSCRETRETLANKEANSFLLENAEKSTWYLEKSFDPYNGGITSQAPRDNTPYLEFHADGTFLDYDGMYKNEGNWFVNKDKSALALVYTNQNNKVVKEKKTLKTEGFQHQIRFLDKDKMVLARQGRHGFVERTYIHVK